MIRYMLALGALVALIATASPQTFAADATPKFAIGQTWSLKAPAAAGVRVVIGRIDFMSGHTIIHVSVLNIPTPDWHPQRVTDISHTPIEDTALAGSVDKVMATGSAPAAHFEDGYGQWRSARGGVFTVGVAQIIEMNFQAMREAMQGQAPGQGPGSGQTPGQAQQRYVVSDGADGSNKQDKNSTAGSAPAREQAAPSRPGGSVVGLTGRSRDNFITGAIRGCTNASQEAGGVRRYGDQTVTQYCTCYANQMADRVTLDEVYAIADQPSRLDEMMGDRIIDAASYCRTYLGEQI
jgi:hypothetical protein